MFITHLKIKTNCLKYSISRYNVDYVGDKPRKTIQLSHFIPIIVIDKMCVGDQHVYYTGFKQIKYFLAFFSSSMKLSAALESHTVSFLLQTASIYQLS